MSSSFLEAASARQRDLETAAHKEAADVEAAASAAARLSDPAAAAEALAVLSELPARVVQPHLAAAIPCLSDEEYAFMAASLLGSAQPAHLAPHVGALLEGFERVADVARWRVVEALGTLEPAALASHAACVARLLAASDADARRRAVELMASMPADVTERHAQAVLTMLQDEDEDCRLSAVELLGKRLPTAALARDPFLPALLRTAASDDEGCVRVGAVGVIGTLDQTVVAAHAPALMARLEDGEWRVRRCASEVRRARLRPPRPRSPCALGDARTHAAACPCVYYTPCALPTLVRDATSAPCVRMAGAVNGRATRARTARRRRVAAPP
jgi:hypothetical protein